MSARMTAINRCGQMFCVRDGSQSLLDDRHQALEGSAVCGLAVKLCPRLILSEGAGLLRRTTDLGLLHPVTFWIILTDRTQRRAGAAVAISSRYFDRLNPAASPGAAQFRAAAAHAKSNCRAAAAILAEARK